MTLRSIIATLSALLALSLAIAEEAPDNSALATVDCTPKGELRGDPVRGSELHLADCAECHGATGKVDVIVMHMDEPPKDQSDPVYMNTLSDAFLYLAICRGGLEVGRSIVMPAWGDYYTDQDIKDLVAHIRSFSGT
jgi:mono/diheme cytochrome c family protein